MSYDFLSNNSPKTGQFQPPKPESQLRQYSSKLPISSRLFPEWAVAAFAILQDKYPQLTISSMSELVALTMQDYISSNYERVDNTLPPTRKALNFLISKGFVSSDNKRQFNKLQEASQRFTEHEIEALSTNDLMKQYEYWESRDPQKAQEILEELGQQVAEGIEKGDLDSKDWKPSSGNVNEEVVEDNRSGLEERKQQLTKQEQLQKQAEEREEQAPIARPDFLEED